MTAYGFLSASPPSRDGVASFSAALTQHLTGQFSATFDVAIVQHDEGLYASHDGREAADVLTSLTVPAIVVLHTVHPRPSPAQSQVLERIAEAADAIVAMSRTAAHRLRKDYRVDTAEVSVVPHGALRGRRLSPAPSNAPFAVPAAAVGSPVILTWGLLRPGKGIEWAIEAVAALADLEPTSRCLVAGRTHRAVRRRDGERRPRPGTRPAPDG